MTLAPGTRLGRYEIRSKIGVGGMGEVYLADDMLLLRKVALKLLSADLAGDRERKRRFEQEALTASGLNHPNIMTVFEIGEADGLRFIATEYVNGETLRRRMTHNRVDLREALEVAIQVASALSAAHKAGVIHRDIKPENIMVRYDDGIVKVLDFGLAKATEKPAETNVDPEAATRAKVETTPGVVMGTANYMSPEQARGLTVDGRTDIWSLGVVLYEMVAARPPFHGETASDVISMILHKEPPALTRLSEEATERLDEIVTKTLAKNREDRYQVAKDLLIDLRRLKQHLDFESEIERTLSPEARSATVHASDAMAGHSPQSAIASAAGSTKASSVEYVVTEIKRHKKGFTIAVGVISLAIIVAASYSWISNRRAHTLTDKDAIVPADFVNTTGDAVFDGSLKQALAIQLEQSPFLNIFPEERVRETLRLMSRSPDERVTKDIAREICQRQGLKAYLTGSISNLGSHYVIALEAANAYTGETLGRQQLEAESKEKVLNAVGQAATKLREILGESLASIQKYDAPIDVATTSSLEALKAYSLGRELHYKGKETESILPIKQAIELDPNFARAYDGLAWSYNNLREKQLAKEAMQKAFELRERTSEYEKLKIAADYYWLVAGDMEKAIEAFELVTRTYPRDFNAHNNLATRYFYVGRYEQAAEEAREAIRLNPSSSFGYRNLALFFTRLNRFDEAKEICEQALAQKLDDVGLHSRLYEIAFVQGDAAAMQQQLDSAGRRSDEYLALFWQAGTATFLGQLRRARELNHRGVETELGRDLKESAADDLSSNALTDGVTGNCQQADEEIASATALPRSVSAFFQTGMALAQCGELSQARSFADEYAKQFPNETLVNAVWLPAIRAAVETRRNNSAQAFQILQSATRYDRTGDYWPEYLRGQAHLAQHAGTEAAAEFQKILDRRGQAPTSVLYPLAYLGVARASALQGDTAKARKAYQDFFALWKDADPDVPILIKAKQEYEQLK
jgi:serine/threonine protein kinase/tetratricopeptide (TPR) repeat protein